MPVKTTLEFALTIGGDVIHYMKKQIDLPFIIPRDCDFCLLDDSFPRRPKYICITEHGNVSISFGDVLAINNEDANYIINEFEKHGWVKS